MFARIFSAAIILITMVTSANAAMTIYGTRVIFPGSEKEQSVRTNNKGNKPALVQVWVDDGNPSADVNTLKVPFVVTPPVYRVEPGKGQTVRLIHNGMALPQDRESVYWFNLLEVPPVDKTVQNADRLELAFRTRIKIFYRPEGLDSSSSEEVTKLKWEKLTKQKGFKVTNPTPYYFSFDSVYIKAAGKEVTLNSDMVAPFSSKEFLYKGDVANLSGASKVYFRLLNDYGSILKGEVDLVGNKGTTLEK